MNTENVIKLRRHKDDLRLAGIGCIFFGLWNIVKFFMVLTMSDEGIRELVEQGVNEGYDRKVVIYVYVVIVLIIMFFVMWSHFRLGMAAIKYSKGKKKRKIFLFFAFLFMFINIFVIISEIFSKKYGIVEKFDETVITSVIVDLTLTWIFFEMIFSTLKIDKYERIEAGTENAG